MHTVKKFKTISLAYCIYFDETCVVNVYLLIIMNAIQTL